MSDDGTRPKQFRYPGIPTTDDGSGTVAWVETNITHGACAYPITSSTVMGQHYAMAVANGKKNLWGDEIIFMDGGVIVEQGPAKQLIEDPQTERLQSFLHRML